MERDIITMNEYGRVTIPTSTNVWMTEAELVALFDTHRIVWYNRPDTPYSYSRHI